MGLGHTRRTTQFQPARFLVVEASGVGGGYVEPALPGVVQPLGVGVAEQGHIVQDGQQLAGGAAKVQHQMSEGRASALWDPRRGVSSGEDADAELSGAAVHADGAGGGTAVVRGDPQMGLLLQQAGHEPAIRGLRSTASSSTQHPVRRSRPFGRTEGGSREGAEPFDGQSPGDQRGRMGQQPDTTLNGGLGGVKLELGKPGRPRVIESVLQSVTKHERFGNVLRVSRRIKNRMR